ncbi:MAG: hypothetical protein EAZ92_13820 [Candidatus Kapaibacterium sp.]|nr:MAG: hypothetical protein EAZ92_13820 [Candidatus Kapabacteria bacterium]
MLFLSRLLLRWEQTRVSVLPKPVFAGSADTLVCARIFSFISICALCSVLSSCVSLRSEYPKTVFYRLEPKPVQVSAGSIGAGLLVKPFTIDSEFDTDHIITLTSATETQPLHYHRWASEPQELLTAAFVNRIQQSAVFTKGVFLPSSSVVPEYQLEARISECLARNAPAQPANTLTLTMHCTLQRIDTQAQQTILLQKVYSQTVQRSSDAASTVAPALSEAAALITDALVKDVLVSAGK